MALIVLTVPLLLLILAAYRGWSIMIVAPVMALVGAALSAQPLMAVLTQIYMPALGGFVVAFLPLFVLGAVFGRLMDDSGAASTIAHAIVDRMGPAQAIPAVVLACAVLTYGGVSLFVVAFAVYPLALALFRRADLPLHLIPGAIALGSFTFTMSALPGTPAIQNAIPMPYFGTTVFAAPGLGVIAALIMVSGGLIYLNWASARHTGRVAGAAPLAAMPGAAGPTGLEGPPLWASLLPVVIVIALNFALSRWVFPATDLTYLADPRWGPTSAGAVTGLWALIISLTVAIATLVFLMRQRLHDIAGSLGSGAESSMLPMFNTASLVGFGAVIASLPAFSMVSDLIANLPGGPVIGLAASASLLAGLTGSASGGMSIALDALGAQYLELAREQGISPELLHRVTALATGGLDALPHNGAVVTLLGIGGMTHKQAYMPIFIVAVAIPVLALLAVLFISSQTGSF